MQFFIPWIGLSNYFTLALDILLLLRTRNKKQELTVSLSSINSFHHQHHQTSSKIGLFPNDQRRKRWFSSGHEDTRLEVRKYSKNIRCDVGTHRTSFHSPPQFGKHPSTICVFYRRCSPSGPEGGKAGGTLYSWRQRVFASLRRAEQRRIIYAPRGCVHKAQIF